MAMRSNDIDLNRQPRDDDRSFGKLISDATSQVSTLVRKEIELAKVETKEEVGRTVQSAGMLGAGAFASYMALFFISLALAFWLMEAMHPAWAFFCIAAFYAAATAYLFINGRKRLRAPVPRETIETLKEDVQWAKR